MSTSSSAEKSGRERCLWCHGWSGETTSITVTVWNRFATRLKEQTFAVHPEHESDLRAFLARFRRHGRTFLVLILGLTLAMMVAAFAPLVFDLPDSAVSVMLGALMALMGVLIIVFPFCTPETVEMMGVKSAVRLGRVLGVVTILLGAVLAVMIGST